MRDNGKTKRQAGRVSRKKQKRKQKTYIDKIKKIFVGGTRSFHIGTRDKDVATQRQRKKNSKKRWKKLD
jgi:hypothetical protein